MTFLCSEPHAWSPGLCLPLYIPAQIIICYSNSPLPICRLIITSFDISGSFDLDRLSVIGGRVSDTERRSIDDSASIDSTSKPVAQSVIASAAAACGQNGRRPRHTVPLRPASLGQSRSAWRRSVYPTAAHLATPLTQRRGGAAAGHAGASPHISGWGGGTHFSGLFRVGSVEGHVFLWD